MGVKSCEADVVMVTAGFKDLFLSIPNVGACLRNHSGASLAQERREFKCDSGLPWGGKHLSVEERMVGNEAT